MAARVNSRFIIIMLAIVSVTAAGVAGLWYVQVYGNVDRLIQQGDELFEQGEYRQAMLRYGRAINKKPGNVEWVKKLEASILAQEPDTAETARDLYERWMTALRLAAEYQATDAAAHLRLIEELHDTSRLMGRFAGEATQRRLWQEVANAADNMLLRVPESDPGRSAGLLYRGMARLHQHRVLNDQELADAERDVVTFLEAEPHSDRGWAALARGHLFLEERARIAGDPRRLAEQRDRLAQVMRQAREAVPDGPEVAAAYAFYHSNPRIHPAGAEALPVEELQQVLDTLVRVVMRLIENGDRSAPWLILDAGDAVLEHDPASLPVAMRLIEAYLAQNDEAIAHHFMHASLLVRSNELDTGERILKDILATDAVPIGSLAHMQPAVLTAAAGLLADIEYRRWTADTSNDSTVAAMRAAVERLERHIADPANDPRMLRVSGKLALMEGQLSVAAERFEKTIREGHSDVETLMASAYCLQRLGEIGLAHQRIAGVVEQSPLPAAILLKAELELELGRLDEAEQTARLYVDAIPAADADAAEHGARLMRTITSRKQGVTHDTDDPVASALHQAQQALEEGAQRGHAGAETARAILLAALENHPEDVRVLGMLATVEMSAGDTESASAYLAQALAIAPDHQVLRQLDALARTGDPIDAAVEFFRDIEDQAERDAAVLRAVSAIRQQDMARSITPLGEIDEQALEAARQRIERADAVISEASQRLRAAAPDHAVLIEHDFNKAIAESNWTLAGQIVQRARQNNTDGLNGLLYEGRFELERDPPRPEHAVRAFQSATEQRPFSNTAWRGLAIAYQRVGNFREAVRAYEQAHAINPNDAQTIRGYLSLLIQVGDRTRAMRVARGASRAMPGDVQMRELWLGLELEHRNLDVVLDRRREIYRANPGDRSNAMRLALFLAQNEPRFDLLRNEQGEPLISERQWNQMLLTEQRRYIAEQRGRWQDAAKRIVDELAAQDARTSQGGLPALEIVGLRATLHRVKGDVPGGIQTLRNHIAALRDLDERHEMLSRAILALAQFQVECGLLSEAVATMREAQKVQDPQTREADLALADFLFGRGQFEQAKTLYEQVREVAPRRVIELRIVEAAINLRQFDQAETVLADLSPMTAGGDNAQVGEYMVEMLRAMIARGRADDLLLRGRHNEAQRELDRFNDILVEAERLSPANPAPFILRAQAKVNEYRRTKNRQALDEAIAALDRAEAIRAGDTQTIMARVEVHREAGNTRSAIRDLVRVLDASPGHVQARRLLAQLQLDGGEIAGAIETIENAIALYPTVAAWHELLGNILGSPNSGRRANRAGSAAAYLKAYELSGSAAMLGRVVSAYVSPEMGNPNEAPDFAAALQVLQQEREAVEREPMLEAVMAHVLFGAKRSSEARQRLARSYSRFRQQIAAGQRQPGDIGQWHQAASTAMASMTTQEIEALLREAGPEYPDRFDLYWLARRLAGQGSQAAAEAIALLERAANAPGADDAFRTGIQFEISGLQIMSGEYSSAATLLKEVVARMPDHWVARNNLAFLLSEHLDRTEEALTHATRAAELRPDEASVQDTLGRIFFHLGQLGKAEEHLIRSLALDETARTQLHMAEVFSAMGRFDDAISRLRRAAELNPDPQTQADIDRLTDDIRTKRASA